MYYLVLMPLLAYYFVLQLIFPTPEVDFLFHFFVRLVLVNKIIDVFKSFQLVLLILFRFTFELQCRYVQWGNLLDIPCVNFQNHLLVEIFDVAEFLQMPLLEVNSLILILVQTLQHARHCLFLLFNNVSEVSFQFSEFLALQLFILLIKQFGPALNVFG